jgi:formiminotetrahydrofolate cyclodeaminase
MILDDTLRSFSQSLADAKPVPGGGSAAGYIGALGAALAGMAIAYSLKRKGLEEEDQEALKEGAADMERFRSTLLDLAEKDCEAYDVFSQVLELPRKTSEEKGLRRKKMKEALEHALVVPLEAASLCVEGLSRLASLAKIISPRLITDAGVSAQCFSAAFHSCWYNIRVNAKDLKDAERAFALADRREKMEAEVDAFMARIVGHVEEILERE